MNRSLEAELNRFAQSNGESADAVEQAETVRRHAMQRDPGRVYLFAPLDADGIVADDSPQQQALGQIRSAYAAQLFSLAERQLARQDAARAYRLLHEVLFFDPEHGRAGLILGARNNNARIMARPGRTRHAKYGWLPNRYWQVQSPHFVIVTNDSEQAGLRLAERLEILQAVWRQLFFDVWSTPAALQSAWRGHELAGGTRAKHRVVLFRSRPEYIAALRELEPRAEITLGYYHARSRTSFFFSGPDASPSTWLHEATHQLFQESRRTVRFPGQTANVWAIEGVAIYMESLQTCGPMMTVGGIDAERLQFARYRALRNQNLLPMEQLVSLGQAQLQQHPDIRQLYSQSAGITHFLMNGESGRHQAGLIGLLIDIYAGRDSPTTLFERTGRSATDIDSDYLRYLRITDDDLRQVEPCVPTTSLVLCGTSVTNTGLLSLPTFADLRWLDAGFTRVDDRGLARLNEAHRLRQLSLERTAVTDLTAAQLAAAGQLEELDLSQTHITDAALATIGKMTTLKTLWLSHTAVTDDGLVHLKNLAQLEFLDVSGTQVTPAALAGLRAALPKLNAGTSNADTTNEP